MSGQTLGKVLFAAMLWLVAFPTYPQTLEAPKPPCELDDIDKFLGRDLAPHPLNCQRHVDEFGIDGKEFILLGSPKKKAVFTLGLNYVPQQERLTSIGLMRLNYQNNVSFYDLRVFAGSIQQIRHKSGHVIHAQLKTSSKLYEAPRFYYWSFYRTNRDSLESLSYRLSFSSGLGVFLYDTILGQAFHLRQNFEAGLAYEYANLDDFSQKSGGAFLIIASEFDYIWHSVFGKLNITNFRQFANVHSETIPDQSRVDSYGDINYWTAESAYMSFGFTISYFYQQNKQLRRDTWMAITYLGYGYIFEG